jgi:tripartite-type tricarboxylate transporter receptor subunit TctC
LTAKNSIGLFAPSGTPGAIVDQIAQASRTVLSDPMFQQLLVEAGYELDLDTDPDKYRRSLEEDTAHWAPLVTALGLKID